MTEDGKSHNVIEEMKRLEVKIMGVSEMRWKGKGQSTIEEHTIYYSGNNDHHKNGVGIIVTNEIISYVKNFLPHSERVMMLQIAANPVDINIIHIYIYTYMRLHQIKTTR